MSSSNKGDTSIMKDNAKVGDNKSETKKGGSETSNSSSVNRFAILDSVIEKDEMENLVTDSADMIEDEYSRKTRAASAGVADLMRNLNPKKRGPIDKGKNK
ncbi:hypothetical protein CRYUN_Cryun24cG0057700 [Craigia yunnanensis]